jgi:hypothetical protein
MPHKRQAYWLILCFMAGCIGCGRIPILSENRENFAPWEKLPDGNGIKYIEKFTRDPGVDPLYLAKISYDDQTALRLVVDTFDLVAGDKQNVISSFAESMREKPAWFPLEGVTAIYVYPKSDHEYVANLWVNTDAQIMILERAWW